MTNKYQKAFSLMELIIALALGLILLYVVGTTLSNASRATNQTMAQMSLHNKGQAIIRLLKRDLECIPANSRIAFKVFAGTHTETSIVFLTAVQTLENGALKHDLAWVNYVTDWNGTKDSYSLYRYIIKADGTAPEPDLWADNYTGTSTHPWEVSWDEFNLVSHNILSEKEVVDTDELTWPLRFYIYNSTYPNPTTTQKSEWDVRDHEYLLGTDGGKTIPSDYAWPERIRVVFSLQDPNSGTYRTYELIARIPSE